MKRYLKWVSFIITGIFLFGQLVVHLTDLSTAYIGNRVFLLVGSLLLIIPFFYFQYFIWSIKNTPKWLHKLIRIVEAIAFLGILLITMWSIAVPGKITGYIPVWGALTLVFYLIRYYFVRKTADSPTIMAFFTFITFIFLFSSSRQIPSSGINQEKLALYILEQEGLKPTLPVGKSQTDNHIKDIYSTIYKNYPIDKSTDTLNWLQAIYNQPILSSEFESSNSVQNDSLSIIEVVNNVIENKYGQGEFVLTDFKDSIYIDQSQLQTKVTFAGDQLLSMLDFMLALNKITVISHYSNPSINLGNEKKIIYEITPYGAKFLKRHERVLSDIQKNYVEEFRRYVYLILLLVPLIYLFFYTPLLNIDVTRKRQLMLFIVVVIFEFALLVIDNIVQGYLSNPFILLGLNILLAAGLVFLDSFIRKDFLKWYNE